MEERSNYRVRKPGHWDRWALIAVLGLIAGWTVAADLIDRRNDRALLDERLSVALHEQNKLQKAVIDRYEKLMRMEMQLAEDGE